MTNPIAYIIIIFTLIANIVVWKYKTELKDFPKDITNKENLYMKLLPVVSGILAILFVWKSEYIEYMFSCRFMMIFIIIWIAALIDHRYKIIPNQLLLVALVVRGILLICDLIVYRSDVISLVIWEILGCIIVFVFCMILRIATKNGVGMGDVKLFSIIPLFIGITSGLQLIFYSMVAIFFEALFLLITKKAGKKDSVPFAPAILIGTGLLALSYLF